MTGYQSHAWRGLGQDETILYRGFDKSQNSRRNCDLQAISAGGTFEPRGRVKKAMNSEAVRSRFLAALALGFALLWGCATSSNSAGNAKRASPSTVYLLKYTARIEEDLKTLDVLVEQSSSTLGLSPETLDSSRTAVRDFLASLSKYQEVMEQVGQNPEKAEASNVRTALSGGEQVHSRLQEQALQLNLVNKVVAGETSAVSEASDPKNPPTASMEYRQVFQRTAAVAASIDDYLNTLHQKSLIPYTRVPHPAVGVFHFLRLRALRDPHLDKHSRYFADAWKTWIQESRKQGRPETSTSIFQLVMELGQNSARTPCSRSARPCSRAWKSLPSCQRSRLWSSLSTP